MASYWHEDATAGEPESEGSSPIASDPTPRGVIFFNLEDETGLLNVVVLPEVWQVHRKTARREIGLVIDGVVEYRDGVTNLVAREFSTWPAAGVKSRDFR